MLAAGTRLLAGIWFEPKVEVWDLAALKLILEEAGGRRIDRGNAIGCATGVAEEVRKAFGVPKD